MKNKEQAFYTTGAILLLAILYWGFDTKPTTQKALEKSRALTGQEFDANSLEKEAKKSLKKEDIDNIEALESQLQYVRNDSSKIEIQKQLSATWFKWGKPILAGVYAKQIAGKIQTAESWAIAGTSFAAALKSSELEEKQRVMARDQAVDAFEHAISLEPKAVEYRVNQALCYIDIPDSAQPMKGVQMLAGLATNYPESALPSYHLARLAVQTGQYERAEGRIEQALKIAPDDPRIACLAVDIYKAVNKPEKAEALAGLCARMK
ncbi:MAG: tetratricopeptide repeat protein [Saprospiraceae bacterium]